MQLSDTTYRYYGQAAVRAVVHPPRIEAEQADLAAQQNSRRVVAKANVGSR